MLKEIRIYFAHVGAGVQVDGGGYGGVDDKLEPRGPIIGDLIRHSFGRKKEWLGRE